MSWWSGPLCGLDFETTSADPETARIVTACIAFRAPGIPAEPQDTRTWLVNPNTPISPEAAAIHGVTDERAHADGMDAATAVNEIRLAFREATAHAPVVIFNAPFDATILDRECRRHGLPVPDLSDVLIVDPLCIDKHVDRYRKGRRTLTAQCEHHGVTLDGAHDAREDTLAAMRLAWKLGRKFSGLAKLDGRALMNLQRGAYRQQAHGLAAYFRKTGTGDPDGVKDSWPVIPFTAGAETTEEPMDAHG